MPLRVGVAAGHFGPDVAFNLRRIDGIVREAAAADTELLVLPHGVLTGYHDHLVAGPGDQVPALPAAVALEGDELAAVVAIMAEAAPALVLAMGITEAVDDGPGVGAPQAVDDLGVGAPQAVDDLGVGASQADDETERANTAVVLDAGGVLGVHRKVHLPAGEVAWYRAGDGFTPVDTPVGRLGLLVDYDKTFPEAARCLALAGAEILVCPCAWPASRTNRARSLATDRQRRLHDLYDRARAAENQLWLLSANQIGRHGTLRFLGQSKVVRPDGEVVAAVGARAGLVTLDIDVAAGIDHARRRFHHLKERRPDLYGPLGTPRPCRSRPPYDQHGQGLG